MRPVGHDHGLHENLYKGELIPLPGGMVRLALEAGAYNNADKTCYSPVLAHAADIRASKADWSGEDCPGWYRYDYRTAVMHEVPRTHHRRRNVIGSKPQAREGFKVSTAIGTKLFFDVKEERKRERLAKASATAVDELSLAAP